MRLGEAMAYSFLLFAGMPGRFGGNFGILEEILPLLGGNFCGAAGAPGRKTEAPQAPLEEIVGAEGAPERKNEAPQAPR